MLLAGLISSMTAQNLGFASGTASATGVQSPVINTSNGAISFTLSTTTTGSPASISIQIEGSTNNGSTYSICGSAGTSTSAQQVTCTGTYDHVRANVTALTGGTSPTIIWTLVSAASSGATTGPTGTPTNTDILTSDGTANHVQDPGGCKLTSTVLGCGAGISIQQSGSAGQPATDFIGFASEKFYNNATRDLRLQMSNVDKFQWTNGPYILDSTTGVLGWGIGGADTGISRDSAGVVDIGTGAQGSVAGSLKAATVTASTAINAATYQTATNCASSASPAVCGSAAAGSVALPTGAVPTLQVNTTAVTANSQIFLQIDEGLGTKLSVTCNTTLSTLLNPVITARSVGASFTFTINATIAVNPACINYWIIG